MKKERISLVAASFFSRKIDRVSSFLTLFESPVYNPCGWMSGFTSNCFVI